MEVWRFRVTHKVHFGFSSDIVQIFPSQTHFGKVEQAQ